MQQDEASELRCSSDALSLERLFADRKLLASDACKICLLWEKDCMQDSIQLNLYIMEDTG